MIKTLVAAACLAVLTYVGYFFLGELRRGQAASESAARQAAFDRQLRCVRAERELADAAAGRLNRRASAPFAVLREIAQSCREDP